MHEIDRKFYVGARLSILTQDIHRVVLLLLLEIEFTHVVRTTVLSNIELLRNFERLRLLLGDVKDFACQSRTNTAKIGRHLEL